jgi:hypothetical protein
LWVHHGDEVVSAKDDWIATLEKKVRELAQQVADVEVAERIACQDRDYTIRQLTRLRREYTLLADQGIQWGHYRVCRSKGGWQAILDNRFMGESQWLWLAKRRARKSRRRYEHAHKGVRV